MVSYMYRMCHNRRRPKSSRRKFFCASTARATTYEPSAKFTTWLYRIATNLAVNHARDTRHERPENTLQPG